MVRRNSTVNRKVEILVTIASRAIREGTTCLRASAWRALSLSVLMLWPSAIASAQEVTEYYAIDAIGSVRAVFDGVGNVVIRLDYGPFGRDLTPTPNAPDRKFAQLFRDGEAGLDYAEVRSYQVRTGRFTSLDPVLPAVGEPQRWNRYAYALNNPLGFTDPTGKTAVRGQEQHVRKPKHRTEHEEPWSLEVMAEMAKWEHNVALRILELRLEQSPLKASVTTSSEVTLPDGSKVRPNTVDPLTQIAQDVAHKAGPLTEPQIYAEIYALSVVGGVAFDALFTELPVFARGGLLNNNDVLRIGWNWMENPNAWLGLSRTGLPVLGTEVFRIAVGKAGSVFHAHVTLWPPPWMRP
jgi:RHS repeat-associated protein